MIAQHTFNPTPYNLSPTIIAFPKLRPQSKIAVIGAGAFGGWSALSLVSSGYNVTLIDFDTPGHELSSSGDMTRVIRSTYGNNQLLFDLNVRARTLWQEFEQETKVSLFDKKGVLWLCSKKTTPIVDLSIPFAERHSMSYEKLSPQEINHRYPEIETQDLGHGYFDSYGGYLNAQQACRQVYLQFLKRGGKFIQGKATPGNIRNNKMESLLIDSLSYQFDFYLFACGPWLGTLFPSVLSQFIKPTKQHLFYFNVPGTHWQKLPVWIEADNEFFHYGIPAHGQFKMGIDIRGPQMHPDTKSRSYDPPYLEIATTFIKHRFPQMKDLSLSKAKICLYENTPDGNFIIDLHPKASNVMFVGGGSGHGFKHGPALGEWIANTLCGTTTLPFAFSLTRFENSSS